VENPVCGDVLKLSAKVAAVKISEIRFQAKGCVASMACGSVIAELACGRTISEAAKLTREDVLRAIGGVPEGSSHAAQLAVDALRVLVGELGKESSGD
jgi:NifU-like protein involved in Fe-S cluster formation